MKDKLTNPPIPTTSPSLPPDLPCQTRLEHTLRDLDAAKRAQLLNMQAGVEDQAIAALTRQNEQVVVPIMMKDAEPVVVRQQQAAPAAPRRAPFSLPQAGANALLSFSDLKRAQSDVQTAAYAAQLNLAADAQEGDMQRAAAQYDAEVRQQQALAGLAQTSALSQYAQAAMQAQGRLERSAAKSIERVAEAAAMEADNRKFAKVVKTRLLAMRRPTTPPPPPKVIIKTVYVPRPTTRAPWRLLVKPTMFKPISSKKLAKRVLKSADEHLAFAKAVSKRANKMYRRFEPKFRAPTPRPTTKRVPLWMRELRTIRNVDKVKLPKGVRATMKQVDKKIAAARKKQQRQQKAQAKKPVPKQIQKNKKKIAALKKQVAQKKVAPKQVAAKKQASAKKQVVAKKPVPKQIRKNQAKIAAQKKQVAQKKAVSRKAAAPKKTAPKKTASKKAQRSGKARKGAKLLEVESEVEASNGHEESEEEDDE
jgi:hypothetical protein